MAAPLGGWWLSGAGQAWPLLPTLQGRWEGGGATLGCSWMEVPLPLWAVSLSLHVACGCGCPLCPFSLYR